MALRGLRFISHWLKSLFIRGNRLTSSSNQSAQWLLPLIIQNGPLIATIWYSSIWLPSLIHHFTELLSADSSSNLTAMHFLRFWLYSHMMTVMWGYLNKYASNRHLHWASMCFLMFFVFFPLKEGFTQLFVQRIVKLLHSHKPRENLQNGIIIVFGLGF